MQILKVGILADDVRQEGWVLDALRRVESVPGVKLGPVVIARPSGAATRASRPRRWLDSLDHLLRTRNENYFRVADICRGLRLDAKTVELPADSHDWHFDADRCRRLQRMAVDVWLCAGTLRPRFAMADVAPRGAWCIEIGDSEPASSINAGAAEIASDSTVTMVSVVDRAVADGSRILLRGFGATVVNSARRNRLNALLKGSCFWQRLLVQERCEINDIEPATPNYPAAARPDRPMTVQVAVAMLCRIFNNQWRKLFWQRQWQLAFSFDGGTLRPDSGAAMHYLVPPADRFWADPFGLEMDGRFYILFEELHYSDWQGRLMIVEVNERGQVGEPKVILQRPWHLSYPFVFHFDGELYLLPESADSGRVELHRCVRFPDEWRQESILLDGLTAYDATLWQQDGSWWMFVSVAPPGAQDGDELHLYFSDRPTGGWQPHPKNPVISDARRARPAGPLFEQDGVLYRPGQNCAPDYGYSVYLNRVDTLSRDDYRETPVDCVGPAVQKDAICLHTIGRHGRLRVFDYQVWRWRF